MSSKTNKVRDDTETYHEPFKATFRLLAKGEDMGKFNHILTLFEPHYLQLIYEVLGFANAQEKKNNIIFLFDQLSNMSSRLVQELYFWALLIQQAPLSRPWYQQVTSNADDSREQFQATVSEALSKDTFALSLRAIEQVVEKDWLYEKETDTEEEEPVSFISLEQKQDLFERIVLSTVITVQEFSKLQTVRVETLSSLFSLYSEEQWKDNQQNQAYLAKANAFVESYAQKLREEQTLFKFSTQPSKERMKHAFLAQDARNQSKSLLVRVIKELQSHGKSYIQFETEEEMNLFLKYKEMDIQPNSELLARFCRADGSFVQGIEMCEGVEFSTFPVSSSSESTQMTQSVLYPEMGLKKSFIDPLVFKKEKNLVHAPSWPPSIQYKMIAALTSALVQREQTSPKKWYTETGFLFHFTNFMKGRKNRLKWVDDQNVAFQKLLPNTKILFLYAALLIDPDSPNFKDPYRSSQEQFEEEMDHLKLLIESELPFLKKAELVNQSIELFISFPEKTSLAIVRSPLNFVRYGTVAALLFATLSTPLVSAASSFSSSLSNDSITNMGGDLSGLLPEQLAALETLKTQPVDPSISFSGVATQISEELSVASISQLLSDFERHWEEKQVKVETKEDLSLLLSYRLISPFSHAKYQISDEQLSLMLKQRVATLKQLVSSSSSIQIDERLWEEVVSNASFLNNVKQSIQIHQQEINVQLAEKPHLSLHVNTLLYQLSQALVKSAKGDGFWNSALDFTKGRLSKFLVAAQDTLGAKEVKNTVYQQFPLRQSVLNVFSEQPIPLLLKLKEDNSLKDTVKLVLNRMEPTWSSIIPEASYFVSELESKIETFISKARSIYSGLTTLETNLSQTASQLHAVFTQEQTEAWGSLMKETKKQFDLLVSTSFEVAEKLYESSRQVLTQKQFNFVKHAFLSKDKNIASFKALSAFSNQQIEQFKSSKDLSAFEIKQFESQFQSVSLLIRELESQEDKQAVTESVILDLEDKVKQVNQQIEVFMETQKRLEEKDQEGRMKAEEETKKQQEEAEQKIQEAQREKQQLERQLQELEQEKEKSEEMRKSTRSQLNQQEKELRMLLSEKEEFILKTQVLSDSLMFTQEKIKKLEQETENYRWSETLMKVVGGFATVCALPLLMVYVINSRNYFEEEEARRIRASQIH